MREFVLCGSPESTRRASSRQRRQLEALSAAAYIQVLTHILPSGPGPKGDSDIKTVRICLVGLKLTRIQLRLDNFGEGARPGKLLLAKSASICCH